MHLCPCIVFRPVACHNSSAALRSWEGHVQVICHLCDSSILELVCLYSSIFCLWAKDAHVLLACMKQPANVQVARVTFYQKWSYGSFAISISRLRGKNPEAMPCRSFPWVGSLSKMLVIIHVGWGCLLKIFFLLVDIRKINCSGFFSVIFWCLGMPMPEKT